MPVWVFSQYLGKYCVLTHISVYGYKSKFINTSDSFAIPIVGERVTWVCIKPLFMTSLECWNMDLTRKLAPVLIRQLLHSYRWRATAETVMPHHAIRATRTAFPYKELFTRGCCVERNHWTIQIFAFILLFDQKVLMLFAKMYMNGNQCVVKWFSTSGLNPPRPGSW